jgi:23S rRNA pseudouridine1911/1915/1917 synthase
MNTSSLQPRIVFEDKHLVVLDKPAGLLSQGESSGAHNLVDHLRSYFGRHYVGLVHRLDRNTSGLMVVAKRSKAADRLSAALRDGTLVRQYLAWLHGQILEPAQWRHYLLKDSDENLVKLARPEDPGAKLAELRVVPQEVWRGPANQYRSLVQFELQTGRSHQIRVQASAAGVPLLGDTKYGAREISLLYHRPALHSSYLAFPHPMGGDLHQYTLDLPEDLLSLRPVSDPTWQRVTPR